MPHQVIDTDPHFIVDSNTRKISYTSDDIPILIKGDHNSERMTFVVPRYVDNHDMNECNRIQIHFVNMSSSNKNDKSIGVYEITDKQVDPDDDYNIRFTWLISQSATAYVGSLTFVVRFACINGTQVEYSWNTSPYVGIPVQETIDNLNSAVQTYTDVLATWYAELVAGGVFGVNIVKQAEEEALDAIDQAEEEALDAIDHKTEEAKSEAAENVLASDIIERVMESVVADIDNKSTEAQNGIDAKKEAAITAIQQQEAETLGKVEGTIPPKAIEADTAKRAKFLAIESIPDNSDLNNFNSEEHIGEYVCSTHIVSNTLKNKPNVGAFRLSIYRSAGYAGATVTSLTQEITGTELSNSKPVRFIRYYHKDSNAGTELWSDWAEIITDANIGNKNANKANSLVIKALPSDANIDDYHTDDHIGEHFGYNNAGSMRGLPERCNSMIRLSVTLLFSGPATNCTVRYIQQKITGFSITNGGWVYQRSIMVGVYNDGTVSINRSPWNELVSRTPSYIPKNADLDGYQTPGDYVCELSSDAPTIKNSPTNMAFRLEVKVNSSLTQELIEFNPENPRRFFRNRNSSNWGNWVEIITKNGLDTILKQASVKHSTSADYVPTGGVNRPIASMDCFYPEVCSLVIQDSQGYITGHGLFYVQIQGTFIILNSRCKYTPVFFGIEEFNDNTRGMYRLRVEKASDERFMLIRDSYYDDIVSVAGGGYTARVKLLKSETLTAEFVNNNGIEIRRLGSFGVD